MIALPVGAQGEHRRDAWDTRSVVERHTRRCISVGTHDGGRPAGERVRTPCSGVSSWGAKVARAAMVTGNGSYGLISDFIEVRGVLTAR